MFEILIKIMIIINYFGKLMLMMDCLCDSIIDVKFYVDLEWVIFIIEIY